LKVIFEKLVYRLMLGTRDQTKLSVTCTRGRLPTPFHPSVLGCSLRTALFVANSTRLRYLPPG